MTATAVDWSALALSAKLAGVTLLLIIPAGIALSRYLAHRHFRGRTLVEAALALPLVLPPTVLGFYLMVVLGGDSWLGSSYARFAGHPLAFSFEGLVVASLVFNLPFTMLPMLRAFEAIPAEVLEAAQCCGMRAWRTFWRIELPLAWPGVLSAAVMTAAHTIGEFGVVLMVGGAIPGQTKTIAISIYDRVQGFDLQGAAAMSALLLVLSLATLVVSARLGARVLAR